ncbi:MAG TPA: lamin tail domain-containing protein [Pyrinomonadaceae bacterium]|nr:lamin tail domain-containing protein [Pyrinomonadaceae bacterium]
MRFKAPITFAIVILTVFGLMQLFDLSSRVQAVSTNIVISEFRVRGPNGAADEFVELYNLSGAPVAIGGWKIRGSNSSGTISDRATITAGTILQSGCHYLVTNASPTGGPYSGAVPGDQTYTVGITDDGGIALTLPDNTIVDQVGMSTGSAFKEGTPLANLGTSNLNRGYERKPGGALGSGTDTDNNAADFQLITPSDPQNSITGCGAPSPTPTPTATPTPSPTPSPSPVANNVIINEIDSDTPGTDVAEFVELYDGGVGNTPLDGLVVVFFNGNGDTSYAAFDLDGRTTDANGYFVLGNIGLSNEDLVFANGLLQNGEDAVALYAANATNFPNGTLVTTANLRDAVVYDTADPDDPGLAVLLNAGQPQVDESSGTAPDADSIGRCPNGDGGARNTNTYIARSPTPDAANNCPAPPVVAKIHEIQGNGLVSPFNGQGVITSGIVTGRKSNGFFIQEPDATVDADPNTSEGIFVFVGGLPAVTVGDAVTVTGNATEFFNLTQIASSAANVSITSSGNPLPAAIVLTTTILDPAGPTTQLERFEGMRMHADSLVSVAPTNEFGEIFTVLEGVARPMREPGIEISLTVPPDPTSGVPDCCIPRWDENPERIMVDTDGLVGSTRLNVTSNVTLSSITGPLDFTFNDYKVLPQTTPGATANMSAVPVPTPAAGEFTVAGFNIENFNNNATQRQKAALAIRDVLHLPDIIGSIEIFDLADLQALAVEIENISGVHYEARLVEADGASEDADQDVAFLVKTSRVQIDSVVQEELAGCDGTAATCNTFIDPNNGQPALLNDRPPLVLTGTVDALSPNPRQVIVIINHLRSFIDIEVVGAEGNRVRAKRKAQSEFLADLLQDLQTANPGTPILSIGDYNAYQFNDGYTDPVATIKGMPTADDQMVVDASPDLVNPNFINLTDSLPADQRYSFIFEGTPQAIDHFVINTAASSILQRYHIARNNTDFPEGPLFAGDATRPERNSDHDMAVGYFKFATAATTTTVADATAVFSPSDQTVVLSATVSTGAGTVNEGTVTFTVRNAANAVVGSPVVGNVSGGVATANYTLPGGTTPQALTITGEFSGGPFTSPSTDTATLSVTFNICLLYDPEKAVKSGGTYPIKLQLCDVNGNNVSSADIVLQALNVQKVSSSIDGDVITSGSSNADNNFRFDNGSYILNLKTTGLSTGVYKLFFTAGADPVVHSVEFQVK